MKRVKHSVDEALKRVRVKPINGINVQSQGMSGNHLGKQILIKQRRGEAQTMDELRDILLHQPIHSNITSQPQYSIYPSSLKSRHTYTVLVLVTGHLHNRGKRWFQKDSLYSTRFSPNQQHLRVSQLTITRTFDLVSFFVLSLSLF